MIIWLVVSPYPPEKYESVGMIIPNISGKKKSKPPASVFKSRKLRKLFIGMGWGMGKSMPMTNK